MHRREHRIPRETILVVPVSQQRSQGPENRQNRFSALFSPSAASQIGPIWCIGNFGSVTFSTTMRSRFCGPWRAIWIYYLVNTTMFSPEKNISRPQSVARDQKKISEIWKITNLTKNLLTSGHSRNQLRDWAAGLENCAWGRDKLWLFGRSPWLFWRTSPTVIETDISAMSGRNATTSPTRTIILPS